MQPAVDYTMRAGSPISWARARFESLDGNTSYGVAEPVNIAEPVVALARSEKWIGKKVLTLCLLVCYTTGRKTIVRGSFSYSLNMPDFGI
jgi:hypothetical protein